MVIVVGSEMLAPSSRRVSAPRAAAAVDFHLCSLRSSTPFAIPLSLGKCLPQNFQEEKKGYSEVRTLEHGI